MKIKQAKTNLRKSLEKMTRRQLIPSEYHGYRDCTDICRSGCAVQTIFDVGANVGQSALKFRAAFPSARIFSFEPVSNTFDELITNTSSSDEGITCHKIALGNEQGKKTIYLSDQSLTNSLVKPHQSSTHEEITISTIDTFSAEQQIARIDLLKIDAEGFDLEVLKGAKKIITAQQVPFILVEAGFHPGDDRHVLFDDFRSFLMPMGYSIFGIYDQTLEWSGEQCLRFANVCFSNESAFR